MRELEGWTVDALTRLVDALREPGTAAAAADSTAVAVASATYADIAAVVVDDSIAAATGALAGLVSPDDVIAAAGVGQPVDLPGLGQFHVGLGATEDGRVRLVTLRRQRAINTQERRYLALSARIVAGRLEALTAVETQRTLREQAEVERNEHTRLVGSLLKRQQLLDNLGRIERSITRRVPLGEVLTTITDAVQQLLGDDVVALRLLDPDDAGQLIVVSDTGLSPDAFNQVRRTPVGAGAGGRAAAENALVVVADYARDEASLPVFVDAGVRAAIAAPVHENGVVAGSLTVATYDAERRYGAIEQETLLAFAEHVSLALTDARAVADKQAAEQAKDNLLAMVSHELKTPLTVMLGVVQTIQRHSSRLSDDVRDEMLTSAQERGYELGRLIDRLLEGAEGTAHERLRDASLPAVISAAITPYATSGRQLLVPPVPPQPLHIDVAKVHGVLSNILETALSRSSRDAPVVIETEVTAGVVSVTVTARGDLPAQVHDKALHRAAGPAASTLGLGVYLAGELAAALGGSLAVGAEAGTMSFTFRFAAGAAAATAKTRRPAAST